MKATCWKVIESTLQLIIIGVMAYSLWQTNRVIEINQEQTEKSTLPVIVFDVKSINSFKSIPIIKNVGVGPAFNIKVLDYKNKDYIASFNDVTGLEKDGQIKLDYNIENHINSNENKVYLDTFENDFHKFISYSGQHPMGRTAVVSFDSTLVITYCDIKGTKYKIAESASFDIIENKFTYEIVSFPTKIK
jgi:hypothetical protein